MKDEGSWHVGNAFVSRGQAEHARDTIKEVSHTFHQEHASPRIASP
jgi:hypothetical protein